MSKLPITGDPAADQLLEEEPLALLIGMLLDQQVAMEWAFGSPYKLKERLGGTLDAATIAEMPVDKLEAVFREKPPLHRYPASMARRTHDLCRALVEHHDGRAEQIWQGAVDGPDLKERLLALPGFGQDKSRIFVALLAKRFDVTPERWEEAAGPFADATPRSAADVDSAESLQRVREFKRTMRAKGKAKDDQPD